MMSKRYSDSVDTIMIKKACNDNNRRPYSGYARPAYYNTIPRGPALSTVVKDTVMKMHGLQTRQQVSASVAVNTAGKSTTIILQAMSPAQMRTHVITTTGSDERAMLRSCRSMLYVANATNVRIVVRAYLVECRKNNPTALNLLLADDVPDPLTPYIDPTTGNAFRRYFKIVKRKFTTIPVEGYKTFKLSMFYPAGKLITGDVEANSDAFQHTVGTQLWMIFADTQPVEDTPATFNVGVALCKLNYFSTYISTHYFIEDNDPKSIETGSSVSSIAAGYVISDATRTQFVNDQNQ